jgi:hypothetical protein
MIIRRTFERYAEHGQIERGKAVSGEVVLIHQSDWETHEENDLL